VKKGINGGRFVTRIKKNGIFANAHPAKINVTATKTPYKDAIPGYRWKGGGLQGTAPAFTKNQKREERSPDQTDGASK